MASVDLMKAPGDIVYALEPTLDSVEFADVLQRSGLGERRPVDRPEMMAAMTSGADVIVTARHADQLIGVSRAISDFAYCTYLSDLAVDRLFQRQGIGRRLLDETHKAAGTGTTLILLAAPAAVDYYPHIGMERHESCWVIRPS